MTYVDVHTQALEECGRQVHRVRNMLNFGDAFVGSTTPAPQGATAADLFGKLDGAAALAAKVDAVWDAVKTDLGEGRNRLQNVERALSEVASNFRGAEAGAGA
jgi:hypothetical protein